MIIINITNIYQIELSILYVRAGKITFRIISKKIRVTYKCGEVLNQSLTYRTKQIARYLLEWIITRIITEPKEIANAFNNYFPTITFELQDKVPHGTSSREQEILLIINGLNQNKTNGSRSIPSDILPMIKSNECSPM